MIITPSSKFKKFLHTHIPWNVNEIIWRIPTWYKKMYSLWLCLSQTLDFFMLFVALASRLVLNTLYSLWVAVSEWVSRSVSRSVGRSVKNRSIRNKNCTWRPCLSTDRDEMSNLYRRPSIVASYQVSVFIVSSFSEIMCTYFVCLYTYEFWLSLWKIVRSSVILLLPIFIWLSSLRGEDLIKSAN